MPKYYFIFVRFTENLQLKKHSTLNKITIQNKIKRTPSNIQCLCVLNIKFEIEIDNK